MELNEKLQALRAKRNITQQELADVLFVSRTAVSKWESGRGYPNIESLRAIAKFYSITLDELLSSDELLSIAEEDVKQKGMRYRDITFGMLDLSFVLMFFLPLFSERTYGVMAAVSLAGLSLASVWLVVTYCALAVSSVVMGVLTLALRGCRASAWVSLKSKISLILNAVFVLLLVLSLQPYAACFAFVFLLIKTMTLIKL